MNQTSNYPTNQPAADRPSAPTTQLPTQPTNPPSYIPPKLTNHGRVAALTHDYPPFFQEMIVAETSP